MNDNNGKWLIRCDVDIWHVIPIGDIEPHFHIPTCHCHPERHPETTATLVVHNSFDRRELSENIRSLVVQ